MNRRDFLLRLGGAAAAISLSPLLDLAEILPAPSGFVGPLTYQGIPLIFDKYCKPGMVYLVNLQYLRTWPVNATWAQENPLRRRLATARLLEPE